MMRTTITFGPNDEDQTTPNGADGDEAILLVGMILVEQLEVVDAGTEELACLFQRETMLLLVSKVLRTVPGDPHRDSVSHWRSQSMAEQQVTQWMPFRQSDVPPFSGGH